MSKEQIEDLHEIGAIDNAKFEVPGVRYLSTHWCYIIYVYTHTHTPCGLIETDASSLALKTCLNIPATMATNFHLRWFARWPRRSAELWRLGVVDWARACDILIQAPFVTE